MKTVSIKGSTSVYYFLNTPMFYFSDIFGDDSLVGVIFPSVIFDSFDSSFLDPEKCKVVDFADYKIVLTSKRNKSEIQKVQNCFIERFNDIVLTLGKIRLKKFVESKRVSSPITIPLLPEFFDFFCNDYIFSDALVRRKHIENSSKFIVEVSMYMTPSDASRLLTLLEKYERISKV